jgi:2-keto-3-deoxy-6-phosphogluconate aldolase
MMVRTPTGRALVGARTVLGLSTVLAPRLAGKAFLLDPDANPQLVYIGRMWGIRNLALAAGLAGASGPNRRRWWAINVGVDVVDALAGITSWRRGELGTAPAVLVTATALMATALGAASLAEEAEAAEPT